jgi:hypothetical protein
MTELTPRQILDAISRALEKTARQFAKDKSEQMHRHQQTGELAPVVEEQGCACRTPSMMAIAAGRRNGAQM